MTEFNVNTHRRVPYKRFKFRVQWDGQYVPGIHRVSGLTRHTEVVPDRSGEDPNVPTTSPGTTRHEPIVLERGRTHDDAFEAWANAVHRADAGPTDQVALTDYRKSVRIELQNEAGQVVMAFLVSRAWPSEYTALGELDAMASKTAVESLVLQHDGWERDEAVTEPTEPGAKAGNPSGPSKAPEEGPATPAESRKNPVPTRRSQEPPDIEESDIEEPTGTDEE